MVWYGIILAGITRGIIHIAVGGLALHIERERIPSTSPEPNSLDRKEGKKMPPSFVY
jgi:hypothetical protein